jgi:transportin-1
VLEKACEDYPRKLDVEINGMRPLAVMIPKFLVLSEHPSSKMRSHAVACLSYFVPVHSPVLLAHMDAFIACLFKRASDEDPSVRRHVCQALVLLLASRPEKLMPEIKNVAEYMLYSTKDKNENVALEACEFWLTFAEDAALALHLHPLLDRVAPVLLDCMLYGEDDLLWLEGDAEDSAVPDNVTDIKPRHYSAKSHGFDHDADSSARGDGQPKSRIGAYGEEIAEDDAEDDYDDLDDEFADEMSTEWNLRKCAAAALDVLAVRFGPDLLAVLLGPLKNKLWSSEWLERESAILALGAMAEGKTSIASKSYLTAVLSGCIEAIEPHLHTLIPYLINTLSDSKPLVRSITCWTLGRYASWCTQAISEEHRNRYFVPTMEGVRRSRFCSGQHLIPILSCSAWSWTITSAFKKLAVLPSPHSKKTQAWNSCHTSSQSFTISCTLSTNTNTRICSSCTMRWALWRIPLEQRYPILNTWTS